MLCGYELVFSRDFEKNNLSILSVVLHLFIYAASLKINKIESHNDRKISETFENQFVFTKSIITKVSWLKIIFNWYSIYNVFSHITVLILVVTDALKFLSNYFSVHITLQAHSSLNLYNYIIARSHMSFYIYCITK